MHICYPQGKDGYLASDVSRICDPWCPPRQLLSCGWAVEAGLPVSTVQHCTPLYCVMCNVLGGGGGGRGQWPLVAGLRLSLPVTGRPGTSQHHVLRHVNT